MHVYHVCTCIMPLYNMREGRAAQTSLMLALPSALAPVPVLAPPLALTLTLMITPTLTRMLVLTPTLTLTLLY